MPSSNKNTKQSNRAATGPAYKRRTAPAVKTRKAQALPRKPVAKGHASRPSKKLFSHPRHTGRVLPRHHTSYPVLMLFVLLAGLFMAGLSGYVRADNYSVNASVKGIPPADPAIITSPAEGANFSVVPATVSGTCPTGSYVKLYRNDFFSGVALCDASGAFEIQTDLFTGVNALKARVFNSTDDEGPTSTVVNVTYTSPAPQPGGSSDRSAAAPSASTSGVTQGSPKATGSVSASAAPFVIQSDFLYKGFYAGDAINWQFGVDGGNAPYAVHIDWGDATSDLVSKSEAGTFNVSHTYKHPGGYKGKFTITVTATDKYGRKAYMQLFTIINAHQGAAGATATTSVPPTTGAKTLLEKLFSAIWPTYFIVLFLVIGFWLGERRELELLKPPLHKSRHA
jgi:hypothetical protein